MNPFNVFEIVVFSMLNLLLLAYAWVLMRYLKRWRMGLALSVLTGFVVYKFLMIAAMVVLLFFERILPIL